MGGSTHYNRIQETVVCTEWAGWSYGWHISSNPKLLKIIVNSAEAF